jgi:hypothetical protein
MRFHRARTQDVWDESANSGDRSFSNRSNDAARIACGEYAFGYITCHDAAGSDDRSRTNPYAGENQGSSAHPYV